MGTRGFAGFVVDGVEKIFIRNGDSYPRGLGLDVLSWLSNNVEALLHPRSGGTLDRIRALRLVGDYTALTPADIQRIAAMLRQNPETAHLVGDDDPGDGEVILEYATYDLNTLLQIGIVEDGSSFPLDSFYCEWGYVIDLDTMMFDAYRGDQQGAHDRGRFAHRPSPRAGFHPVAVVASWPLAALPDPGQFEARLGQY